MPAATRMMPFSTLAPSVLLPDAVKAMRTVSMPLSGSSATASPGRSKT